MTKQILRSTRRVVATVLLNSLVLSNLSLVHAADGPNDRIQKYVEKRRHELQRQEKEVSTLIAKIQGVQGQLEQAKSEAVRVEQISLPISVVSQLVGLSSTSLGMLYWRGRHFIADYRIKTANSLLVASASLLVAAGVSRWVYLKTEEVDQISKDLNQLKVGLIDSKAEVSRMRKELEEYFAAHQGS